jgi:hypothetical protein
MGLTDLTDLLDMPNLSPENMRIAAEIVQMFTQGNRQQQESIQQDRYRQQALDAQRTEGAADRQNRLDLAQIQADAASGRDQFDPRVAEATRQATLERAQQAITVIQAMGAEDLVHKLPTFLEALKADPETFHQVRAFLQSPAFLDQARGAISPSLHDLSRVQNDVVAGEPEIVTDSNGHRMVRPGSYRSGPTTSVWDAIMSWPRSVRERYNRNDLSQFNQNMADLGPGSTTETPAPTGPSDVQAIERRAGLNDTPAPPAAETGGNPPDAAPGSPSMTLGNRGEADARAELQRVLGLRGQLMQDPQNRGMPPSYIARLLRDALMPGTGPKLVPHQPSSWNSDDFVGPAGSMSPRQSGFQGMLPSTGPQEGPTYSPKDQSQFPPMWGNGPQGGGGALGPFGSDAVQDLTRRHQTRAAPAPQGGRFDSHESLRDQAGFSDTNVLQPMFPWEDYSTDQSYRDERTAWQQHEQERRQQAQNYQQERADWMSHEARRRALARTHMVSPEAEFLASALRARMGRGR